MVGTGDGAFVDGKEKEGGVNCFSFRLVNGFSCLVGLLSSDLAPLLLSPVYLCDYFRRQLCLVSDKLKGEVVRIDHGKTRDDVAAEYRFCRWCSNLNGSSTSVQKV